MKLELINETTIPKDVKVGDTVGVVFVNNFEILTTCRVTKVSHVTKAGNIKLESNPNALFRNAEGLFFKDEDIQQIRNYIKFANMYNATLENLRKRKDEIPLDEMLLMYTIAKGEQE